MSPKRCTFVCRRDLPRNPHDEHKHQRSLLALIDRSTVQPESVHRSREHPARRRKPPVGASSRLRLLGGGDCDGRRAHPDPRQVRRGRLSYRAALAGSGAVSLFGSSKQRHEQLARHLLAERCTPTQAKGIKVDVWTEIPGRENDLFDCLVGCCVAASIEGVAPEGVAIKAKKPPRKVRLSDLEWAG
jgi:hypothetical protein